MSAYKMRILMVVLIVVFAQPAWADDCRKITTTGSAAKQLKPDVAYITVFVNGEGVLMTDAAKKADQNVETVLKAVRDGRTNIIDVIVSTIDVGEKQSRVWSGDQQSALPRPQVSKQIQIVIPPDPALAYDIIDAAIRTGAILTRDRMMNYSSEVRGTVVYGVKDGAAVEEDIRKVALEDARKQAEKLAQWAGKSIGPLCSIGCQSTTTWPQSIVFRGIEMQYPTKYVSTNSQQIEIKASISATFELQD